MKEDSNNEEEEEENYEDLFELPSIDDKFITLSELNQFLMKSCSLNPSHNNNNTISSNSDHQSISSSSSSSSKKDPSSKLRAASKGKKKKKKKKGKEYKPLFERQLGKNYTPQFSISIIIIFHLSFLVLAPSLEERIDFYLTNEDPNFSKKRQRV